MKHLKQFKVEYSIVAVFALVFILSICYVVVRTNELEEKGCVRVVDSNTTTQPLVGVSSTGKVIVVVSTTTSSSLYKCQDGSITSI